MIAELSFTTSWQAQMIFPSYPCIGISCQLLGWPTHMTFEDSTTVFHRQAKPCFLLVYIQYCHLSVSDNMEKAGNLLPWSRLWKKATGEKKGSASLQGFWWNWDDPANTIHHAIASWYWGGTRGYKCFHAILWKKKKVDMAHHGKEDIPLLHPWKREKYILPWKCSCHASPLHHYIITIKKLHELKLENLLHDVPLAIITITISTAAAATVTGMIDDLQIPQPQRENKKQLADP